MRTPFALTAYPLSHDFRARLETELDGVPEYLSVPQLRRLGRRRLLEELLSLSGRPCLLPLEDPASSAVLPLLEVLALAARPSSIVVVRPDLRRQPISRWRLLPALGALGAASADGLWTLRSARKDLERLLAAAPSTPTRGTRRRVLYLNGNLWFGVSAGGSLAHMAGVANGLADAGYELELAASFHVPQLREGVRDRVVAPPEAFAIPSETNYFRYQRSLVEHSLRVAAAHAPDFVYQRLSILNYAGVTISRQLGVPLVLEYNGSEVWVARHWGRRLRYERLAEQAEAALLRHAHVVVTVSDVLREELLGRGIPERHIVMYPNCVDAALFDPARFTNEDRLRIRARYGLPKNAFVATFVGTFGRWHGTEVLARAVRGLICLLYTSPSPRDS